MVLAFGLQFRKFHHTIVRGTLVSLRLLLHFIENFKLLRVRLTSEVGFGVVDIGGRE